MAALRVQPAVDIGSTGEGGPGHRSSVA